MRIDALTIRLHFYRENRNSKNFNSDDINIKSDLETKLPGDGYPDLPNTIKLVKRFTLELSVFCYNKNDNLKRT